jgi:CubicO group peptidase (beta-lactamase class C family)
MTKLNKNDEKLKAWMDDYVEQNKFNGCSLTIADTEGNTLLDIASGHADKEKTKEFNSLSIVRIFSMTKAIVSTCLLQLLREKKINVEDTLDHYFDNYCNCYALVKNAKNLTELEKTRAPSIYQLLNHTSGLSYFFNDDLIGREYLKQNLTATPDNDNLSVFVEKVSSLPLAFKPGVKWNYSVGIDIAGRLIEIISGEPLDVYISKNLLDRLDMKDTQFFLPKTKVDRFTDCFFYNEMHENFFPLVKQYENFYYQKDQVTNFSGGSGLLSTGRDYLKFASLLLNGGKYKNTRIFEDEVVKSIRINSLDRDIASIGVETFAQMPTRGMGHSLAGSVITEPHPDFTSNLGDFGWGGMASNYFWIDFEKRYTVVFMTQLLPSASYPNRKELKKLVHQYLR